MFGRYHYSYLTDGELRCTRGQGEEEVCDLPNAYRELVADLGMEPCNPGNPVIPALTLWSFGFLVSYRTMDMFNV